MFRKRYGDVVQDLVDRSWLPTLPEIAGLFAANRKQRREHGPLLTATRTGSSGVSARASSRR